MAPLQTRLPALRAVRSLLADHGLPSDRLEAWKDGSNLLVRPVPVPVVLRVATFTGRVRGDAVPYLEREVALVAWLADRAAPVMPPATAMPAGPFVVDGVAMAAFGFVAAQPGVVPGPAATLDALDALHAAMRDYPGALPPYGPAADDLDRVLAFCVREAILARAEAARLAARRDELVAALHATTTGPVPQHGDAFPRNAVVTPDGRTTWVDLEDACRAPLAWDLATLVRNTGDPAVRATAEARVGPEALGLASELRGIQARAWAAAHDARVARGW